MTIIDCKHKVGLNKHPVKHHFANNKTEILRQFSKEHVERKHRKSNDLLPKSYFHSLINGEFILAI